MKALAKLERMVAFLGDFRALREKRRGVRLVAMKTFLHEFEEIHRRVWRTRVDFNVFSLLGVRTDEASHSRVLAWLLDAESGHGQGDLFTQAFVDLCGLDIPAAELERYAVRTEFVGQEAIIDVMVSRRGAFLVYVENKVYAPEGPQQVDREYRDMQRHGAALGVPPARQYAIFLTPYGRAPVSGDAARWKTLSYGQLAAAFAAALPSVSSDRVRLVVEDWVKTISRIGGVHELVI